MFCAYVTGPVRALIDCELYLPKSWTEDRDRCREAGVGDDVQFAAKPELARLMLGRALEMGVLAAWVTADEADGWDWNFWDRLEQRCIGYVVAVAKPDQAARGDAGLSRADVLGLACPGPGMEAPQRRERVQVAPRLRLGGGDLAGRRW